MKGVPTARSVDFIGISVPDLDGDWREGMPREVRTNARLYGPAAL